MSKSDASKKRKRDAMVALEVGKIGESEKESGAESEGTTPMVNTTVLHTMELPALAEIVDPS
jgi:hypothetical protein